MTDINVNRAEFFKWFHKQVFQQLINKHETGERANLYVFLTSLVSKSQYLNDFLSAIETPANNFALREYKQFMSYCIENKIFDPVILAFISYLQSYPNLPEKMPLEDQSGADLFKRLCVSSSWKRPFQDCRVVRACERKQRRLDSLARVLSLRSGDSVCTAVSIYNNRLVIAANMDRNHGHLASLLECRLQNLREYLFSAHGLFLREQSGDVREFILRHTSDQNAVFKAMFKPVNGARGDGTAVKLAEFIQAIAKLFISFAEQETEFSDPEAQAILFNPPRILLPSDGMLSQLGVKPELRKTIHAEQLIAQDFISGPSDVESCMIGVSKLCCAVCMDSLTRLSAKKGISIEVRGTHGQTYDDGVYDLFERQLIKGKGAPAITGADMSSPNTPEMRIQVPPQSLNPLPPIDLGRARVGGIPVLSRSDLNIPRSHSASSSLGYLTSNESTPAQACASGESEENRRAEQIGLKRAR